MKKAVALVLSICIFLLLFAVPSSAEGEVYVAAGNTVLPLTDAMPIRSSGVWYIDYQCFTKGNLSVSSSYNAAERTLVLYTWDTTLVFDLNKTVAYTTADKVQYKAVSFTSSGTVYVPVQFTAQMLGLDYMYFSDFPMVRIKRSNDIPNDMFYYIAQNAIPEILAAYNASKNESGNGNGNSSSSGSTATPPTVQPPPQEAPDESDTTRRNIRLTFNIQSGKNMKTILDLLARYGYRATFFVQGSAIVNCENELRRAVAGGHALGTLAENGNTDFAADADTLAAALKKTNDMLFEVARTKTRLVRVPAGSKNISTDKANLLISLGYRIWDDNITPQGSNATKLYSSAVSQLEKNTRTTVTITLTDSGAAVSALSRLLRYLGENKYRAYAITVLDTPINDIGEKR